MKVATLHRVFASCALLAVLAACGGPTFEEDPNIDPFDGRARSQANQTTLLDALRRDNSETNVSVNRYIWSAAIETLNFLPVESADPFTGVIVTGFGTPPGGSRAYRATILIRDPALDARSLNVALQTRSGPASPATVRAVEDAILTRARQLRVADRRL